LAQLFRQSEEIIIIKRNCRHWCWQMCCSLCSSETRTCDIIISPFYSVISYCCMG